MLSYRIRKTLRQVDVMNNDCTLNIVVIGATHERYEQQLCKTGHNFFSVRHGKEWDLNCGAVPNNYHIVDYIPNNIMPDLIITHVSGERLDIAQEYAGFFGVNVIRHTHTLPENEYELQVFRSQHANINTFISGYSKAAWNLQDQESLVVEHGLDADIFCDKQMERENSVLSVVNLWADRDWACGWNLYNSIKSLDTGIKYVVYGNNKGLSRPAKDLDELVNAYNKSSIFLNTSQFSPVPMAMLEAMSCGCAIVSTNNCMIPEIIKHGYNGLLANSPEELHYHIKTLQNNPQMARQMGLNARQTIIENYNIRKFCNTWNDIFRKTILL